MRLSRRKFLAGAAALAAAGAVPAWLFTRRRDPRPDQRPEHVILIDWDGLDPTYLSRAPTPNLDSLTSHGSLSTVEGVFPTLSNPARASIATGAYPETHGNLAYYYDEQTGRVVGANRSLAAESVAETLVDAGKTVASVQWYTAQGHGVVFGDQNRLYVEPGGLFEARVDAAIDILQGRPVNSGGQAVTVSRIPDFLAVYGSDLDDLGQAEGPDGPNIVPLLVELDRQLGRLVQAIRDAGIYERTAFILTGDHGMTTWSKDLTGDVLAGISDAGYVPEIVTSGNSPEPDTEVVIVPDAVRIATLALLGRAKSSRSRLRTRTSFEEIPGVARVLDEADLQELRCGDQLGDLVVEAEEPWGFAPPGESDSGTRGAHGSTKEMRVPLLLSGAGVHQDVTPRSPRLVDVAPTICALLGARPPRDAQGRILSESLGF